MRGFHFYEFSTKRARRTIRTSPTVVRCYRRRKIMFALCWARSSYNRRTTMNSISRDGKEKDEVEISRVKMMMKEKLLARLLHRLCDSRFYYLNIEFLSSFATTTTSGWMNISFKVSWGWNFFRYLLRFSDGLQLFTFMHTRKLMVMGLKTLLNLSPWNEYLSQTFNIHSSSPIKFIMCLKKVKNGTKKLQSFETFHVKLDQWN